MKNISKYNRDSQYEYIWVPEINADKKVAKIDLYKDFYDRHMYLKDGISMSYRQFVPSGLIIQPQHRDLVVTAPFVLGVISMSIEQVLEGCALYARLLTLDDLRLMEE